MTTDERQRSFIAIELSDETKALLGALRDELSACRCRASWLRPDNYHLTFCFLGDISVEQQAAIAEHMEPASAAVAPFTLSVRGLGAFPSSRKPQVVWVGAHVEGQALQTLHAAATEAALAADLQPDMKPFRPHITLGRVREQRGVGPIRKLLQAHSAFDAGQTHVDRVSLFASKLASEGAVHTKLLDFPLACP
ncbi:MAG: RNA 2',3'-cyclic phosphodiesterase [Candidatus Hydrogenedentales bacterium]